MANGSSFVRNEGFASEIEAKQVDASRSKQPVIVADKSDSTRNLMVCESRFEDLPFSGRFVNGLPALRLRKGWFRKGMTMITTLTTFVASVILHSRREICD